MSTLWTFTGLFIFVALLAALVGFLTNRGLPATLVGIWRTIVAGMAALLVLFVLFPCFAGAAVVTGLTPPVLLTRPGAATIAPVGSVADSAAGASDTTNNGAAAGTVINGIQWGPAGQAPQTVAEAIKVLQLDQQSANYLTKLNPAPGDDRVIGWVVGTSVSESQGVVLNVGRFPSGTCVDRDPHASTINGATSEPTKFTDKWWRVLMTGDGNGSGRKYTVYWTPCDLASGDTANNQASGDTANQASGDTANNQASGDTANNQASGDTANQASGDSASNCVAMSTINSLGGKKIKDLPPNGQVRDFGGKKIKVPAGVVAQWTKSPNNKTPSDGNYVVTGVVSLYAEPLCG